MQRVLIPIEYCYSHNAFQKFLEQCCQKLGYLPEEKDWSYEVEVGKRYTLMDAVVAGMVNGGYTANQCYFYSRDKLHTDCYGNKKMLFEVDLNWWEFIEVLLGMPGVEITEAYEAQISGEYISIPYYETEELAPHS